jgi:hypothetical protein
MKVTQDVRAAAAAAGRDNARSARDDGTPDGVSAAMPVAPAALGHRTPAGKPWIPLVDAGRE